MVRIHDTKSIELRSLISLTSLIPLMGVCYMLQYMDKLALSQATLFNLQEDLVGPTVKKMYSGMANNIIFLAIESQRDGVQLVLGCLLFRILRLELAKLILDRTTTSWKVLEYSCIPLGWSTHVPCSLYFLCGLDGG